MTASIDFQPFRPDTVLADLLRSNLHLSFVLNQFSIPMGFGDKTIGEVCRKYGVDCDSFITMLQLHNAPDSPDMKRLQALAPELVLNYLRSSHRYFLEYRLPVIRRQIGQALPSGETKRTILAYFKEYENEVLEHMNHENDVFFPYAEQLIRHAGQPSYSVRKFEARHNNIEEKLNDFIHLLLKYLPTEGNAYELSDVLESLQQCNVDLNLHAFLENEVLVPGIRGMELSPDDSADEENGLEKNKLVDELSEREKEIVQCVAQGMSNKETADRLFLSVHTVITHRRNISRKLGIHSTAGLTVYAILNKLIDIGHS